MNQKMREYQERNFEQLASMMVNLAYTVRHNESAMSYLSAIRQFIKHIEHGVLESDKCEDCQDRGLVDAPGPTDPSELRIHDANLPEPDMMGGPLITEKIQIIQIASKPQFQVWLNGMTVPYYTGSHNQCMIVHGYMTLYPDMTLEQMNDDSGGYLSEAK